MKKLSLKAKLLLTSGFLLVISLAVGITSYISLKNVSENYDDVVEHGIPKLSMAYEMMLDYRRVRITLETLGLQGLTPAQAEEALMDHASAVAEFEKDEAEYLKYELLPGQKEVYEATKASWLEFKAMGDKVIALHKSGQEKDLEQLEEILITEFPKEAKEFTADVMKLIEFENKGMKAHVELAKTEAMESDVVIFFLILAGFIIGMTISILVATRISQILGHIAKDLMAGAVQVAQASDQISGSSQALAQASVEQASSLEQTVSAMEEMSASVKVGSDSGKEAATLAGNTHQVAARGEVEIKALIGSILSLSADSKKMTEIIGVIDDIAFQTNILALNASVEAARAGEQGKGFAVVAESVRTLSQKTSVAAKDIGDLIKGSVDKIEAGAHQAAQGGKVLGEIVNSVKKVAELTSDISNASDEQTRGINQITGAMNTLEQVGQENAAASEEAAAAAEELSAQSESLRLNAEVLTKEVYGAAKVG